MDRCGEVTVARPCIVLQGSHIARSVESSAAKTGFIHGSYGFAFVAPDMCWMPGA